MWPPMRSARSDAPGSVNHWFPASSVSSEAPSGSSFPESHSRAPDPGIRPRDALRAVLVAGELSQLLPALRQVRLGSKRHGGQLYKLPGLMGRGSRPIKRWRNDRQRKKKERDRRRATEKKTK
jgi:hypothetical protein